MSWFSPRILSFSKYEPPLEFLYLKSRPKYKPRGVIFGGVLSGVLHSRDRLVGEQIYLGVARGALPCCGAEGFNLIPSRAGAVRVVYRHLWSGYKPTGIRTQRQAMAPVPRRVGCGGCFGVMWRAGLKDVVPSEVRALRGDMAAAIQDAVQAAERRLEDGAIPLPPKDHRAVPSH